MLDETALKQFKQRVITDFNSRKNYDNAFRYRLANRLVELAKLQSGQKILDVATGTGLAAIAAAQIIGEGYVVGVDISQGMLRQAQENITAAGLKNIELRQADAEYLDFSAQSFDAILCSCAIAYITDLSTTLNNWYRFLKPSGIVGFSCFAQTAHTMAILFRAVAKRYGITIANPNEPLGTPQKCYERLQKAGFKQIEVLTQQFGSYLNDPQWMWNTNVNSAYGFQVLQLEPSRLQQCKAEYFAQVEALSTQQGFWTDVTTFFVLARK